MFALAYVWNLPLAPSSGTASSDGSRYLQPESSHKASTASGGAVTCNLCALSPQEASCAYVLIVTAVYWVSEAVPLGAAALVPAFLYPLFGVMKSSEVRPVCTFLLLNILTLR